MNHVSPGLDVGCAPASMALKDKVLPTVLDAAAAMVVLRRKIHANPELAYEEFATSDLVAERLSAWGYRVHRGLGGTGVVGTMTLGDSPRSIGIRADMDALPIHESTGLPYASKTHGKMHACGHDGHTAILLAAAQSLARPKAFNGTVHLIFQPAEEGYRGAQKMMEDGLFERFPCDAVFALHNIPGYPAGSFGFMEGAFMASADTVHISVKGKGAHGATPHLSSDPIVAAAHMVVALQTVVARNVDPREMAVVTVGAIHGGDAPNVIPEHVQLSLTVRAYSPEVRNLLRDRIQELVRAQAATFGVRVEIDYQWCYPPLINDARITQFARQVAIDWLGEEHLIAPMKPRTGSEDFAFFLQQCPGSYLIVGNGVGEHHSTGGCMVHNPGYDFNDAILPIAASYWEKLVERFLSES